MKIISGGQTGADMGGLLGAVAAGIKTGGIAPRGWRTEAGSNPLLGSYYGLSQSDKSNYNDRTVKNIQHSNATVIFADKLDSAGTILTINTCRKEQRPYICNPSISELRAFIKFHNVMVLNVAGNRESVSPGIQERTKNIIYQALK